MSHYGLKIPKGQAPDKSQYTLYYPHILPIKEREWENIYVQFVSIDPGTKNFAFRIERRYYNGKIETYAFEKHSPLEIKTEQINNDNVTINHLYNNINLILNKHKTLYETTHYIIIERQLPQNYMATRVAQHFISYFIHELTDKFLRASILEVDPKLKGKMLKAPKGMRERELKVWSTHEARRLFVLNKDNFSLNILDKTRKKDDLADTKCQTEAICILFHLPLTIEYISD
jgi:hypothetical protein